MGHFNVLKCIVEASTRLQTRQAKVYRCVIQAICHYGGVTDNIENESQAAQVAVLALLNADFNHNDSIILASADRAQLLYALMSMDPVVSKCIVAAVVSVNEEYLNAFVNNADICRHVIEPLVEEATKFKLFNSERRQLLRRLLPLYPTLAEDMSGRFLVLKCFAAGDAATRFKIAKILAAKRRKLEGTKFGRMVVLELNLDDFESSRTRWINLMKKHDETKDHMQQKMQTSRKRKVQQISRKVHSNPSDQRDNNESELIPSHVSDVSDTHTNKKKIDTEALDGYSFLLDAIKATKK